MPVMDGFEFIECIRENKKWREIPIVVTTAKKLTPEDRQYLEAITIRLIEKKNYTMDSFIETLSDLITQRV